jgi:hypothetical protein
MGFQTSRKTGIFPHFRLLSRFARKVQPGRPEYCIISKLNVRTLIYLYWKIMPWAKPWVLDITLGIGSHSEHGNRIRNVLRFWVSAASIPHALPAPKACREWNVSISAPLVHDDFSWEFSNLQNISTIRKFPSRLPTCNNLGCRLLLPFSQHELPTWEERNSGRRVLDSLPPLPRRPSSNWSLSAQCGLLKIVFNTSTSFKSEKSF